MSETAKPVPVPRRPSLLGDLVTLTKPRIISLLLVTTIAPMFITPAGLPSLALIGWVTLGGYLMAGGANAVNMYLDRDIDDRMARTRLRPIPSGRMGAPAVLAFGVALATAATFLFARAVNVPTAALALAGFYFYVFIYTRWLKRATPQNIVIGGAAGAAPPVLGWTAITGTVDPYALLLFLIVFVWTPPHFWALAIHRAEDYANAEIPMLPVTHGIEFTALQTLLYTILLVLVSVLPWLAGMSGYLYLAAALVLGAIFMVYAVKLKFYPNDRLPMQMFSYSIVYLIGIFAALLADHWLA